jgi:hypothetical protein
MSNSNPSPSALTPEEQHRRQTFWQVYVPLFLGAAVFVALCVWTVIFTIGYKSDANLPDQQSPAAKVAVIWILLPGCFGGLIQLAILGGLAYGMGRGIRGLPGVSHQALAGIQRLSALAQQAADRLAAPVIAVNSQKAGLDRLWERIAFWKHKSKGV